jgi:hypothetical protein
MGQFTKRVNLENDGGYKSDDWYVGYHYFGHNGSYSITNVFRFTNVTVPVGAVITSAYLKFTAYSTEASSVKTKIAGIAEDNTGTMSSDPTGRTKTTNKTDWDFSGVTQDTVYTSPDIKAVIQEIIDRAGWNSGQAMGFFVSDDGTTSGNLYSMYGYDDDSTKAPYIEINYTSTSFSPSKSPSLSPSKSPSVSPSMSPSPGVSYSPSVSPSVSLSPSASPSVSPSISKSPSKSPSISPSISPSVSPEAPPVYGLRIKKPAVNKNVDEITDPKELVFTSALGVLGLRLLDTVTAQTNASGNIDVTDNHSIGYPPITIVTTTAYDGNKVNLPVEWHSIYLNGSRETIEVTETFNFKVTGTSIEIIVHAEEYNYDTDTTSNISGRSYTFNIYYYFNELVET